MPGGREVVSSEQGKRLSAMLHSAGKEIGEQPCDARIMKHTRLSTGEVMLVRHSSLGHARAQQRLGLFEPRQLPE